MVGSLSPSVLQVWLWKVRVVLTKVARLQLVMNEISSPPLNGGQGGKANGFSDLKNL